MPANNMLTWAGSAAERWSNGAVGLALRFQSPSRVRDRLRRSVAGLLSGAVLALAILAPATAAHAHFWGGFGSTTSTNDYNLGTNWGNPPVGAPPVAAGQNAAFDASGSASIDVTSPVTPHSWTFFPTSQSYTISGSDVNFSAAGGFAGSIAVFADLGQTISIANNIGESAPGVQVLQQGSSTLKLADTNTYSGGTTISSGGALQVTNNSSVGSGAVTLDSGRFQADGLSDLTFTNNFKVNAGGGTIDANGIALTISGNITDGSGPGALTVVDSFGGGVVILTGTNSSTGGTTICSCATLQLRDATPTGSIIGAVTNEGVFNIVNANTAGITSINNDIGITTFFGANTASSIAITNRNGGETDFGVAFGTDTATAGSSTITNRFSGLTLFFANSTAGNANITNRFGGTTLFVGHSSAGNATITNDSSGSFLGLPVGLGFFEASTAGTATIINNNHGFIAFGIPFGGDTSSADHAVITNNAGSALEFDAFTTAGNATITTLSGGAVEFFDGSTGGNAQFITNGTSYVDFSGSLGPNGDGRITAGSIADSGFYYIGAGNTLVVGGNNFSTKVSGVIADFLCGCFPGPGALEKVGTGTLTLSGTNTYTGTTTVNGGVLDVEGSIASSSFTTVNANAALTGAGFVGDPMIAHGGLFLPDLD